MLAGPVRSTNDTNRNSSIMAYLSSRFTTPPKSQCIDTGFYIKQKLSIGAA